MRIFWTIIVLLAAGAVVLGVGRERGDARNTTGSSRVAEASPPAVNRMTAQSICAPPAAMPRSEIAGTAPATPAPTPTADTAPRGEDAYIAGGSGTADDPFAITWDLLMLSSATYRPRLGMTEIPPRVKAIDGRCIKIAGYYTAPVASDDSREVLFMLNEWDGCCLGAPPTPYDGIEVHLKTPIECSRHSVTYGTLTGVMHIEPFVRDGWLLGMYVVNDGEIQIGM